MKYKQIMNQKKSVKECQLSRIWQQKYLQVVQSYKMYIERTSQQCPEELGFLFDFETLIEDVLPATVHEDDFLQVSYDCLKFNNERWSNSDNKIELQPDGSISHNLREVSTIGDLCEMCRTMFRLNEVDLTVQSEPQEKPTGSPDSTDPKLSTQIENKLKSLFGETIRADYLEGLTCDLAKIVKEARNEMEDENDLFEEQRKQSSNLLAAVDSSELSIYNDLKHTTTNQHFISIFEAKDSLDFSDKNLKAAKPSQTIDNENVPSRIVEPCTKPLAQKSSNHNIPNYMEKRSTIVYRDAMDEEWDIVLSRLYHFTQLNRTTPNQPIPNVLFRRKTSDSNDSNSSDKSVLFDLHTFSAFKTNSCISTADSIDLNRQRLSSIITTNEQQISDQNLNEPSVNEDISEMSSSMGHQHDSGDEQVDQNTKTVVTDINDMPDTSVNEESFAFSLNQPMWDILQSVATTFETRSTENNNLQSVKSIIENMPFGNSQ